MSLIIETGAGIAGADSFLSLVDARGNDGAVDDS